MSSNKKTPNVKLQKTSVIFMQLGLILAMFIVYVILEHESFYKPIAIVVDTGEEIDDDPKITVFTIEKPKNNNSSGEKTKTEPINKLPTPSSDFKMIENESNDLETAVLESTEGDEKPVPITLSSITEVDNPDDGDGEVLPFINIEIAPEFPGCKGTKEEKKTCFNTKINKFVQRKFNAEIAQELGLPSGRKKIAVQFVINRQGDIVDVKVRAPHKRLEREAKRIVSLLPKMKPAIQGKNTVNVRFNLPIIFNVED